MLSDAMLSVVMLSVVMLSVFILSVVLPSVVMLSVIEPFFFLLKNLFFVIDIFERAIFGQIAFTIKLPTDAYFCHSKTLFHLNKYSLV